MGEQGMTFLNGIKVYNEVKINRLKKIYDTLITQLNESTNPPAMLGRME